MEKLVLKELFQVLTINLSICCDREHGNPHHYAVVVTVEVMFILFSSTQWQFTKNA